MKKLLVLMLVLGMASVANAALMLSINGDTVADSITLEPSQTFTIDVYNDYALMAGAGLDIIVTGDAEISGWSYINPVLQQLNETMAFELAWTWQSAIESDKLLRVSGGVLTYNTVGPYTLLDDIEFHCTGPGLVTVTLVTYSSIDVWHGPVGDPVEIQTLIAPDVLLDTITITPGIPEPMTVLLLGLGGLFLRRRK